jgi:hypothetical protein
MIKLSFLSVVLLLGLIGCDSGPKNQVVSLDYKIFQQTTNVEVQNIQRLKINTEYRLELGWMMQNVPTNGFINRLEIHTFDSVNNQSSILDLTIFAQGLAFTRDIVGNYYSNYNQLPMNTTEYFNQFDIVVSSRFLSSASDLAFIDLIFVNDAYTITFDTTGTNRFRFQFEIVN